MHEIAVVVVGAHLTGQPLNHQLTERGGQLLRQTTTAPNYRFYALTTTPPKPGLVRVENGDPAGAAIEVEVWALDAAAFGAFVDEVAPPLAIGHVQLLDGSWHAGFVCEPIALAGAEEITRFGGWRSYLGRDG